MRSIQTKSFPLAGFFRHATALALFWAAWRYLSEWYIYRGRTDYIVFSSLFFAALIIAAWSLAPHLKQAVNRRMVIVLLLFLIILPWGEWLQRSFPNAREDWSRQLFKQAVLLYILILLLSLKPRLLQVAAERVRATIGVLAENRILLWMPCLLFLLVSSWIAIFVFQKCPIVPDSASYLFQAKTFAESKLAADAPPVPDFFNHVASLVVMKDGYWFSIYSPGFPFLLSTVVSFGLEWFVCPLLGALTCGIWIAYVKRWHSRPAALLMGWMILFSPFLLLLSATTMVHPAELFLVSAAIYVCRREIETPRIRFAILLFVVLGCGVLTRSFSFLAFLGPVLAYTFWTRLRARSLSFPAIASFGIVLGILMLFFYNWKTVGDPFIPPNAYAGAQFGFGEVSVGQIHSPARGLENTSNHLLSLSSWLSGWGTGSLFFVLLFLICISQLQVWDRVLLLACGTLVSFYFFYYYQDLILGPRFYFVCSPVLLLMIANLPFIKTNMRFARDAASILIVVLSLYSLLFSYSRFVSRLNPNHDQAGLLKKKLEGLGDRKILVFLDKTMRGEFVGWNDPFLKGPVILCLDLGHRNREAIQAFPDHDPLYFGVKINVEGMQTQGTYDFYKKRSDETPGSMSLFGLAMALQAAGKNSDADAFDVCYGNFLPLEPAKDYLSFLDSKIASQSGGSYKMQFQQGIVHAGKLILLPKKAWDQSHRDWVTNLDPVEFSREYDLSMHLFRESGDSGQPLAEALEKIGRRIDQDGDGTFSLQELKKFLSPKIKLLEFRTYF